MRSTFNSEVRTHQIITNNSLLELQATETIFLRINATNLNFSETLLESALICCSPLILQRLCLSHGGDSLAFKKSREICPSWTILPYSNMSTKKYKLVLILNPICETLKTV